MLRRPGLAVGVTVNVGLMTGFLLTWSDIVGAPSGSNLYREACLVESAILAFCLPWAALRSMAVDRDEQLLLLSILTGLRPSSIIAAKTAAVAGLLTLIALSGLPVLITASQMAAVPFAQALPALAGLFGLVVLVAALSVVSMLVLSNRLMMWLTATGCAVLPLSLSWRSPGDQFGAAALVAAIALTGLAMRRQNYLRRWSSHAEHVG
jgi:hypothetical protein